MEEICKSDRPHTSLQQISDDAELFVEVDDISNQTDVDSTPSTSTISVNSPVGNVILPTYPVDCNFPSPFAMSNRGNILCYDALGYEYRLNHGRRGSEQLSSGKPVALRCNLKGCNRSATFIDNGVTMTGDHNHPPTPALQEKRRLVMKMKEARAQGISTKDVMAEIEMTASDDVRQLLPTREALVRMSQRTPRMRKAEESQFYENEGEWKKPKFSVKEGTNSPFLEKSFSVEQDGLESSNELLLNMINNIHDQETGYIEEENPSNRTTPSISNTTQDQYISGESSQTTSFDPQQGMSNKFEPTLNQDSNGPFAVSNKGNILCYDSVGYEYRFKDNKNAHQLLMEGKPTLLRCNVKGCNKTASLIGNEVTNTTGHDHPPVPGLKDKRRIVARVKEARALGMSTKDIMKEIESSISEDVRPLLPTREALVRMSQRAPRYMDIDPTFNLIDTTADCQNDTSYTYQSSPTTPEINEDGPETNLRALLYNNSVTVTPVQARWTGTVSNPATQ